MSDKYELERTSLQSAIGTAKVLAETTATRLLLTYLLLVDNTKNPNAKVKVSLVHQRKSPKGTWEDAPNVPLSSLKAGEQVKFHLDCETTLELYRQLENLFAIAEKGQIGQGKTSLIVSREEEVIHTDESRARVIKLLLSKGYSDDIWKALIDEEPDLATQLSFARIHSERQKTLDEFRLNLNENHREEWWQNFFEKHTWIFGYGLKYQILKPIQAQPRYGGQTLSGKGTEKGDYLQKTEAQSRFTVLVEIKKPNTALLGSSSYRNGAWQLGEDLVGGISQLQANCRRWEIEGSRTDENRELLAINKINTVQPKGILVIGNTAELDEITRRNTFELFRRNVVNPEIVTFDELFERAKFIVEHSVAEHVDDLDTTELASLDELEEVPF